MDKEMRRLGDSRKGVKGFSNASFMIKILFGNVRGANEVEKRSSIKAFLRTNCAHLVCF